MNCQSINSIGDITSLGQITANGLINGYSIQGNSIICNQSNPNNGFISAGGVLNVGTNYNPLTSDFHHSIKGSILNVDCSIINLNGEVNFKASNGHNFNISGYMNQFGF